MEETRKQDGGPMAEITPDKLSHLTAEERRDWELAQKAFGSVPRHEHDGIGRLMVCPECTAANEAFIRFTDAARTGYPAALAQLSAARGEIEALNKERDKLKEYVDSLPANWNEDSSLKTWFPFTAEELSRLRDLREKLGKILDDPDRKVEYGTPEYFLIQRLRVAFGGPSEGVEG